jgi:glycosyltransferase involved in cell wall biosynthesis
MRYSVGIDANPLLGERAGVGNYTGRLLAAMLERGRDWEFLLYSNRPLGQLEETLTAARPVGEHFTRSHWLWMQLLLPRIVARSEPDLLHFTNSLAPLRLSRPYVLTVHDASLFLHGRYHPKARLLTVRLILPFLAKRAASIITMSNNARRDLVKVLRLPPEKIEVIYEAAPPGFHREIDAAYQLAVRKKYGLPDRYLLYVGTIEPRKNLSRLVRAFGQLRQQGYRHQLILAGPNGWQMDGFTAEIERLELQKSIRMLGYVPAEDLPGLYSQASVFVFPSLYEGFGLPPLEAMACGVPVLTSNNSSLAEICADAAHLVNPRDEGEIVNGLRALLDDPDWRAELARRGRHRSREFSWSEAAGQTMALYERVLGENGHR